MVKAGPQARPALDEILIISPGGLAGGGGIGTVTRQIVAWHRAHAPDLAITVLDPRGDGPFVASLVLLPLALARAAVAMAKHPRSLVHVQLAERSSMLRKGLFILAARALGRPVLVHHHGAEFESFFASCPTPVRRLIAWTLGKADVHVTLGQGRADYLSNVVGVSPASIAVLPNAVADVREESPRPARTEADGFQALLLANLSPRKGVSEFLRATARLRGHGLNVRPVLCGGGQVDRYREEARQLGLEAEATFTGWLGQEEVYPILRRSDVLALPSHDEGLPMAILEALSAAVPVVATPVGSIPEVLSDGHDCLLVPPGDAEALAEALRRVLTDPALRARLTANGRALYEARFEIGAYIDKLHALYERAASR
jgi:glycosyltransferase involved in cell wall biosynthesis